VILTFDSLTLNTVECRLWNPWIYSRPKVQAWSCCSNSWALSSCSRWMRWRCYCDDKQVTSAWPVIRLPVKPLHNNLLILLLITKSRAIVTNTARCFYIRTHLSQRQHKISLINAYIRLHNYYKLYYLHHRSDIGHRQNFWLDRSCRTKRQSKVKNTEIIQHKIQANYVIDFSDFRNHEIVQQCLILIIFISP